MIFRFDPDATVIRVDGNIPSPMGLRRTILALDTAATQTCIAESLLASIGLNTSVAPKVRVATANGEIEVPEVMLPVLSALGHEKNDFKVLAVNMPSSTFSGVLGLDFFRDKVLRIDFRNGTIDLQ